MELSQVESFLKVSELGSITRAAEVLCVTQPAVTQQIRGLERELGAPLFERTGRGMVLTAAGHTFLAYARRCSAALAEGRREVLELDRGGGGRLGLGAGVTTCIFRLPPILRAFREQRPDVEVVVRTGGSRETTALVRSRELDLGLVTSEIAAPDLVREVLFEEEIVLVTPPDYRLGSGTAPEVLAGEPLVLYPRASGFRDYLDRTLAEAGVTAPRVIMETDSVEAIKSFVEVGLGISFLPGSAVAQEVAIGRLVQAEVSGLNRLTRRTSVLYRTGGYLSGGARRFLEILRERLRTEA